MGGNRVFKSLVLAGVAALALTAVPAQAQSVEELVKRIEALEKDAYKAPRVVQNGTGGLKLTLSGQVNQAVMYGDNGEKSSTMVVDNNNSSTRFRLVATGNINADWSIGSTIELEAISNNSRTAFPDDDANDTGFAFRERIMEARITGKQFGTVYVGQGLMASDTVTEQDTSGMVVVAWSDMTGWGGGLRWVNNGVTQSFNAGNVINHMDGLSRLDRVRYDTPTFNGFQLRTSVADEGQWDVGAFYSGKLGEVTVAGGIAYADTNSVSSTESQISGSLSAKFSAFSVTVAAGQQELKSGARDPMFYYGKLAYDLVNDKTSQTAVAVDYGMYEELRSVDGEASAYGVYLLHVIKNLGTDLYAGVRLYDYEAGNTEYDTMTAAISGIRVRF